MSDNRVAVAGNESVVRTWVRELSLPMDRDLACGIRMAGIGNWGCVKTVRKPNGRLVGFGGYSTRQKLITAMRKHGLPVPE